MGQACCKRCCPRHFSSSSSGDGADRGPGTEVFLGSLQSPQNRAALAASAEEELRVNVIVYGECAVGKTCLRNRFVEGRYTPEVQATIGVDFNIKTLQWTPIGPHGPGNPHRVKVCKMMCFEMLARTSAGSTCIKD
jgi:Ras family